GVPSGSRLSAAIVGRPAFESPRKLSRAFCGSSAAAPPACRARASAARARPPAFLASLAAIYLLFRYAVVIPPAGWVAVIPAFVLFVRWARRRPRTRSPAGGPPARAAPTGRLQ